MYYYSLRINATDKQSKIINKILGIESNYPVFGWGIEIIQNETDCSLNPIDYFLKVLEGNYDRLKDIGIFRSDISIWILYEYREQCNLEFSPKEMEKIGREGITLCISCWET